MSWKIYVLRTFLILYVIGDVVLSVIALAGLWVGDSELAIQLIDHDEDLPIDIIASKWSVVFLAVLVTAYLWCLIRLFMLLDKLVVTAHRGALANLGAAQTLRGLGRSLVALWVSLMLVESLAPLALFWTEVAKGEVDLIFSPFDLKILLALLGFALTLVAGLAEEANDMKKELSGVV